MFPLPSRVGPADAEPTQVLDRHVPQLVERLGVASENSYAYLEALRRTVK